LRYVSLTQRLFESAVDISERWPLWQARLHMRHAFQESCCQGMTLRNLSFQAEFCHPSWWIIIIISVGDAVIS